MITRFKNVLIALSTTLVLSGCVTIPSFWDDNESKAAIDLRYSVSELNCSEQQKPQVAVIKTKITWLLMYTESKGSDDIAFMIKPMSETVNDFYNRGEGSEGYCKIKKKVMESQSKLIADAILRRF
jgi:uncharacterized protein YceK